MSYLFIGREGGADISNGLYLLLHFTLLYSQVLSAVLIFYFTLIISSCNTNPLSFLYLQPIDIKREEFRKYLERAGVMEALTKVLVLLYEETEKPTDALEYPSLNVN